MPAAPIQRSRPDCHCPFSRGYFVRFVATQKRGIAHFTSPACGGGRRARRARRVGEKSIPPARPFFGNNPTPTPPRKRAGGHTAPARVPRPRAPAPHYSFFQLTQS